MKIISMTSLSAAIYKTVSFQFGYQFSNLRRHKFSIFELFYFNLTGQILECITVESRKSVVAAPVVAEIIAEH